jgi:hypothetical protein
MMPLINNILSIQQNILRAFENRFQTGGWTKEECVRFELRLPPFVTILIYRRRSHFS